MDDFVKGWIFFAIIAITVAALFCGASVLTARRYTDGGYCEHKFFGSGSQDYISWSKPPRCGVEK